MRCVPKSISIPVYKVLYGRSGISVKMFQDAIDKSIAEAQEKGSEYEILDQLVIGIVRKAISREVGEHRSVTEYYCLLVQMMRFDIALKLLHSGGGDANTFECLSKSLEVMTLCTSQSENGLRTRLSDEVLQDVLRPMVQARRELFDELYSSSLANNRLISS